MLYTESSPYSTYNPVGVMLDETEADILEEVRQKNNPRPIPRYHLDRCEPVMDRDDEDGEYCRWDDVQPFVECEPCEGCHLSPANCQGLTLKQACEKISKLQEALKIIIEEGDYTAPEGMKHIAKAALEI